MSNKQQTSIDWLIEKHFGGIENCTPYFKMHIEQAKVIHKEEIIKAWKMGDGKYDTTADEMSSGYYNETFNNNE